MISDCQLKTRHCSQTSLNNRGPVKRRPAKPNNYILYKAPLSVLWELCIKQKLQHASRNVNFRMNSYDFNHNGVSVDFPSNENDKWHVEVDSSILHAVWLARGVNNKTTAKLKGRETKLADMYFFVLPNGWACKDKICFNLLFSIFTALVQFNRL